jgi:hypothetical protein
MNKIKVRRLSVGVILLAYFMPWLQLSYAKGFSGVELITQGIKDGIDYGNGQALIIGLLSLSMGLASVGLLIKPLNRKIAILVGVLGVIWLAFFYIGGMSQYKLFGAYVFTIGIFGVYYSNFLKD